jgi:AraC-like DNA-binding protein
MNKCNLRPLHERSAYPTSARTKNGQRFDVLCATAVSSGEPSPGRKSWPAWLKDYSQFVQPCRSRLLAPTFKGSIRVKQLGGITCVEVSSTSQWIFHDKIRAAPGVDPFCVVCLQLEGDAVVAQAGREAVLEPNDLVVRCSRRPSETLFAPFSKQLVFKVPYGLERPRLAQAELSYGAKIDGKYGAGVPISQFFRSLWANIDLLSVATYPIFEANISNMTELALALTADRIEHCGPTVRHIHLRRIIEHIETNLADPTLNPTDIARQHGFSSRYLHKIFDVTGQTISEYIRRRRLKRCCEDLMDPTSRHLHIGQLSMRWGFTDAAHFSHVFRDRYGQSPREFRKLMKSQADEKFC